MTPPLSPRQRAIYELAGLVLDACVVQRKGLDLAVFTKDVFRHIVTILDEYDHQKAAEAEAKKP